MIQGFLKAQIISEGWKPDSSTVYPSVDALFAKAFPD